MRSKSASKLFNSDFLFDDADTIEENQVDSQPIQRSNKKRNSILSNNTIADDPSTQNEQDEQFELLANKQDTIRTKSNTRKVICVCFILY
jgi:hypothetical protein